MLLKEYHGLTFQEIAELQGCPLSTVKTRLYQGLTVLRRELERSGSMTRGAAGEQVMSDKRWCGNPDVLMSYLYEDGDERERAAFETHLAHVRGVRPRGARVDGGAHGARAVDASRNRARLPHRAGGAGGARLAVVVRASR